jgi:pyridoxine kinase
LTDDLLSITNHWKTQNINFDAIYTGYLGSFKQLNIVKEIFEQFKNKNNFILVDPVMADNGQLYHGFNIEFAKEMAKLCSKADIIVPNLTEASFMLGTEYIPNGYSEEYIKIMLKKLADLGAKKVVLTGVSFDKNNIGAYAYDSIADEYFYYAQKNIPVSFHGTGDIFASSLCGALTIGKSVNESISIAVDYTVESIKKTIENKNHNWYGVDFEQAIPYLINKIF